MSDFGNLCDKYGSDKNSTHSYGPIYDQLFSGSRRENVKRVLEIGVQHGYGLLSLAGLLP